MLFVCNISYTPVIIKINPSSRNSNANIHPLSSAVHLLVGLFELMLSVNSSGHVATCLHFMELFLNIRMS